MRNGFTIVELLIVIVVIGILAAITLVAFSGISERASVAATQSALTQANKKLALYISEYNSYPVNQSAFNTIVGSGAGPAYQYTINSSVSAPNYCVTATIDSTSYYTLQDGTTTPGTCPMTNGLIGWWRLNGNANDSSGNGYSGVVNAATPTIGQNGLSNGAYNFVSANTARITVGDINGLKLSTQGSINAWITSPNWSTAGGTNGVVNYGGGGYWLSVGVGGQPAFYLQSSTAVTDNNIPSNILGVSQWYHLVVTFDPSNEKIYLNGSLIATYPNTVGSLGNYDGSGGFMIGAIKNVSGRYYNGSIDDVRVYNRALSLVEVQSIYAVGAQ
ncbi:MAG: LamG-like jellyroll fold domain-containing protein [Candidatus Microsaccharimonas sp.]